MMDASPIQVSAFTQTHMDLWVGLGAGLGTFVASVVAKDQDDRLRNGTFGAVAGSAIGGVAALLTNQPALLVVGFLGSAVGACLGWLVYLGLSRRAKKPDGRLWLEYYVGGFKGLRDKLDLDDQLVLLAALKAWRQDFSRMLLRQQQEILSFPQDAHTNKFAHLIMETWLIAVTDIFGLVFETLAKKPYYRWRITVIVFGSQAALPSGKHWITYTGPLPNHKPKTFDKDSIGYKVLSGAFESPYFTTGQEAKDKGQDRGQQTYRPFFTFRVNEEVIMALDWHDDLAKDDPYVKIAADLFHIDVAPAVGALLKHWSGSLASEVGLQPLSAIPPVAANSVPIAPPPTPS